MCANLADPALAGATCGRDLAVVAAPGLLAEHKPLRAARGHGPAVATGLRWTCGPDSTAGGQR